MSSRLAVWPPLPPALYLRRPPAPPFPLGAPGAVLFARARHGLYVGVQALGLMPGDEVLVPAYHHGSEVEALLRAGIRVIFYEATDTLAPDEGELEALVGSQTRALYLIHYLGFPQDAARWRRWCDDRQLLLMEDAAQAWLADVDGQPVGSLGDLAVFCLYKTYGLPDGAVLLLRRGTVTAGPSQSAGLFALARRHVAWLAGRSAPVAAILRPLEHHLQHDEEYRPEEDFALGTAQQPSPATRFLLRRCDPGAAARRRAHYVGLLDRLGESVSRPFDELPAGAAPFAFPLTSTNKAELLERLARAGVNGLDFWSVPHPSLPVAQFPGAAARRASTVLLPVHQELRVADIERIGVAASGGQPFPGPRAIEVAGVGKVVATRTEPRLRPEHGWVAAALPAKVRGLRVADRSLAGMLADAGADVNEGPPEVEIGPASAIAGVAPLAIVPIVSFGPLVGPRPLRMTRRAAAALGVRARAARARSLLRRRGYAVTTIWPWDVEQVLRLPGAPQRPRKIVEYLPRAAVVSGRRSFDMEPSLLDAVVSEAGRQIDEPLDGGRPYVSASGTLLLFTRAHVLRIAVGPARRHLDQHRTALVELAALDPPPLVADRLPRVVAGGEVEIASWLLEDRLPGAVPDKIDGQLFDQVVEYLVALHGCGGAYGEPLALAAETVAAISGTPSEPLIRLARQLDDDLAMLPRGFGHGDFWRKNVLADGGRLLGVADWERAGDGRLPLLDLLQLTVAQPPLERRAFAAVVTEKLLPWARAGGSTAARRYCEQLGLETPPPLLRSLVLAFWLDRLARELDKCGDRGRTPAWLAGNVDPVLAIVEDSAWA